ncbi:biopolymer transporter ExbD [bacterium]|nr:biopolymer transporter ExbD [bacterium]
MAGRYKPNINHNSEFELDLAPLLAVMVKLVPVLLVSSAFVQMMIIETELPQVVQQALAKQDINPKVTISMEIDKKQGVNIIVNEAGNEKIKQISMLPKNEFDFEKIHLAIQEIKKLHPEIFKIEFNPSADVSYKDIVKIMDEVRKTKSNDIRFPVKDEKTGQLSNTDYMFPEVIFANTLEG